MFTDSMHLKSYYLVLSFTFISLLFFGEIFYLNEYKSMSAESLSLKRDFVSLTKIPDLVFFSEESSLRHRTLSSTSDIYHLDPILIETELASFSLYHRSLKGQE